MLVSVIIPTLNRPTLLLEAVSSVMAQSFPAWEVIVVDDCSEPPVDRDRLREMLGERVRVHRLPQSGGIAAAKNAGAEIARGDLLLFLDDDDLLMQDALAEVTKYFVGNHRLECLFVNVTPFGRNERRAAENQARSLASVMRNSGVSETGECISFGGSLFEALLRSAPIAFQRIVVRREGWRSVGGYPVDLKYPEPYWALLASTRLCTALLLSPQFKWRVDNQNYMSLQGSEVALGECLVQTKLKLLQVPGAGEGMSASRRRRVTESLAREYQGLALLHWRRGARGRALRTLARSWHARPSMTVLKLALKVLLFNGSRGSSR